MVVEVVVVEKVVVAEVEEPENFLDASFVVEGCLRRSERGIYNPMNKDGILAYS